MRSATSADPVVRTTAEATTPDLAALAALDAYLARFGIVCATPDRKLPEEEGQPA